MARITHAQAWPTLFTTQEARLLSDTRDSVVPFRGREQILRSGMAAGCHAKVMV